MLFGTFSTWFWVHPAAEKSTVASLGREIQWKLRSVSGPRFTKITSWQKKRKKLEP